MSRLYPELRRPPPLFPLLEVFAGFRILPGSIRTQSKSLVTRIGNSHPGWQGFAGKGKGISKIRPGRATYSPQFQRFVAVPERPKRALGLHALRHQLQRTRRFPPKTLHAFSNRCTIPSTRFSSAARLTVPVRCFGVQRRQSPGSRGRDNIGTRTGNGKLDTFHRSRKGCRASTT
jgi:hypothetical protein